jgi:hypothetical protein
MFQDGIATFYIIEHQQSNGDWCGSELSHFLFDGLPYMDKMGELGNHYRKLLEPQSASSSLWQKFGLHGYTVRAEAAAMLAAVGARHPGRAFRLVQRTVSQESKVLVTVKGKQVA